MHRCQKPCGVEIGFQPVLRNWWRSVTSITVGLEESANRLRTKETSPVNAPDGLFGDVPDISERGLYTGLRMNQEMPEWQRGRLKFIKEM